jgi:hypothetical protein
MYAMVDDLQKNGVRKKQIVFEDFTFK